MNPRQLSASIRVALVAAALGCAACGLFMDPDEETGPEANIVEFKLDGEPVDVQEAYTLTFISDTKQYYGPYTHLFMTAGTPSQSADRYYGEKISINLPEALGVGEHRVYPSAIPNRDHAWIELKRAHGEVWGGHSGTLVVEEIGGVGGRFKARFTELQLSNECGDIRTVSDGRIDVQIGSDIAFPEMFDPNEEVPSATLQMESAMMLTIDGSTRFCPLYEFYLQTYPPSDSGTGQAEDVFVFDGFCGCDLDPSDDMIDEMIYFGVDAPAAGSGTVSVSSSPYLLYFQRWTEPVQQYANLDSYDSELFAARGAFSLNYNALGEAPEGPVDIELAAPVTVQHFTGSGFDSSNTVSIEAAHAFGRIARDCRPGVCY